MKKPFFIDDGDFSFALLTNGSLVVGLGIKVTRIIQGMHKNDVQICDIQTFGYKW